METGEKLIIGKYTRTLSELNLNLEANLNKLEEAYSVFESALKLNGYEWLELAHDVSHDLFELDELHNSLQICKKEDRNYFQKEINEDTEILNESLHSLLYEIDVIPERIKFVIDDIDDLDDNFPDSAKLIRYISLRYEESLQDTKSTLTEIYELTSN